MLADLPEEQRPIAEMALQGMSAVRARVKEENAKLEAAGQPAMPEQSVVKMAEDMLPKLRVAEWLDRAEAAQRQMEHLDLRDLRSVVAAGEDPSVARDLSTRAVADDLKKSLVRKLGALTGQRGAPPAWMASHPPTADRIAAIEAREARWGLAG